MPRSSKMFVEQSNLTMPSSVWLHVNGVSLATDTQPYEPPVDSYDYRTKHLQSPVQPPTPPLISPTAIVPYSITMIDGPFGQNNSNNRYNQRWENTDMSKKFFVDRHIKKAKSLTGLIKGTALSRHTPQQSATFTSPALQNSSINTMQDDQLPLATVDNDDDSLPIPPTHEQQQTESRRPRVYFADFNKIEFIEQQTETSQQQQQQQTANHYPHRRHRRRLTKKTSNTNGITQISPSIQQTQILQNFSRPLSRQPNHQLAQELNIKKQQLASPRIHSSRITHLPDILNQSLPIELTANEKYTLQREKPLMRTPKPIIEIPSAGLTDITVDEIRNNNNNHHHFQHSFATLDSHNQTYESDSKENNSSVISHGVPTISQTSVHRQPPSLRTISLRQQFLSPVKLKATHPNHQPSQQQLLSTRRSALLKPSNLRIFDDRDDSHTNNSSVISTIEPNRLMTSARPTKQIKRSDGIHYNSRQVSGGHTNHESAKLHVQDKFRNLLTIVRPPYAGGGSNGTPSTLLSLTPNESIVQSITHPQTLTNFRTTRSTSARGSFGYNSNSSTIIV